MALQSYQNAINHTTQAPASAMQVKAAYVHSDGRGGRGQVMLYQYTQLLHCTLHRRWAVSNDRTLNLDANVQLWQDLCKVSRSIAAYGFHRARQALLQSHVSVCRVQPDCTISVS